MMIPRVVDIYWREPATNNDFPAMAKAGIWGLIHKSSEGGSFQDKKFKERKKRVLDAGMLWGAYHFANGTNVKLQVDNFLTMAGGDPKTCLVLDWEDNPRGTKMSRAQAIDFLGAVYMQTGQRPAIYGGNTIKEALVGAAKADVEFFAQHRLWLCQYGPRAVLPRGFSKYWLWQYTGDGLGNEPHELPGVSMRDMDLNVFNGSREALMQSWAPGYADTVIAPDTPVAAAPSVPSVQPSAGKVVTPWWRRWFT